MSLTASRFVLCLCLAGALPAGADTYTIRGAGPCDEWKADAGDRGWLLGYISGYNAARSTNLTEGMKNDDLVEQMTQICKEDPSQDFDDAVQVLIGRLVGEKATMPGPTPPAQLPPAAPPPRVPPAPNPASPSPVAAPAPPTPAAATPAAPPPVLMTQPAAPPTASPNITPSTMPPPAPPRSTLRPTAGSR